MNSFIVMFSTRSKTHSYFDDKVEDGKKAHFIVTYGPAGSGKGFIKNRYMEYLKTAHPGIIINDENTFYAEIDNFVEKNDEYKKAIIKNLDDFFKRSFGGDIEYDKQTIQKVQSYIMAYSSGENITIDTAIEDSINIMISDLNETYFLARKPFNEILDKELANAIEAQKNIIYETTGGTPDPIGWLWKFDGSPLYKKTDRYVFSIVYPFVQDTTIEKRNIGRFITRLTDYYVNIKKASVELSKLNVDKAKILLDKVSQSLPPRIVNPREVKENAQKAQKNIIEYTNNGVIDHVLLYDNNTGVDEPPIDVADQFRERLNKGRMLEPYKDQLDREFVQKIVESRANLFII